MIGAVAVVLTLYSTRLYFQEVSQKLNRTLAERMVSEQVLMQEGRVNDAALKDIFHQLMVINPSIELYLLDPQGTILTFRLPQGRSSGSASRLTHSIASCLAARTSRS